MVIVKFATCGNMRIFISVFLAEVTEKESQSNVSLKVNGKYYGRALQENIIVLGRISSGLVNRNYQ